MSEEHKFKKNDIVIDENGLYYNITSTNEEIKRISDYMGLSYEQPAYELERLNTNIGVLQSRTFLEYKRDFEKRYTFFTCLPLCFGLYYISRHPFCPVYIMMSSDVERNTEQKTFTGFTVSYVIVGGADMGPEKIDKLANDKFKEIRDHNNPYENAGKKPPTLGTKLSIEEWLDMKPIKAPWSNIMLQPWWKGWDEDESNWKCPYSNLSVKSKLRF